MKWIGAAAVVGIVGCSIPDDGFRLLPKEDVYLKASNAGRGVETFDRFATALALSADGSTLAVSATGEDGSATIVNGNDNDDLAGSGAVYVFVRTDGHWMQQAYLKVRRSDSNDSLGTSVALSADGSTLVIGAIGESSKASTVDGEASDNSLPGAGAAYVFRRTDGSWNEHAYLKPANPGMEDGFGNSVAISDDGMRIAVGALQEDTLASGPRAEAPVDDNGSEGSGAVYIFDLVQGSWTPAGFIKPKRVRYNASFGAAVALSGDGAMLVVGTPNDDGGGIGIDPDDAESAASEASGAVFVFSRIGSAWQQSAYLKASNAQKLDHFGQSIAVNGDGTVVVVGAPFEDDVDVLQSDAAGAAYVYVKNTGRWREAAYLQAPNVDGSDLFGSSVAISSDGAYILAGASGEASRARGVGGDQLDNSVAFSGAAYLSLRSGDEWHPYAYLKASNTATGDRFGTTAAIADDGATLAIGAPEESSAGQGIDAPEMRVDGSTTGAVYVFR